MESAKSCFRALCWPCCDSEGLPHRSGCQRSCRLRQEYVGDGRAVRKRRVVMCDILGGESKKPSNICGGGGWIKVCCESGGTAWIHIRVVEEGAQRTFHGKIRFLCDHSIGLRMTNRMRTPTQKPIAAGGSTPRAKNRCISHATNPPFGNTRRIV